MSRVHDALKKAGQAVEGTTVEGGAAPPVASAHPRIVPDTLLTEAEEIPYRPTPESLLLGVSGEEGVAGPSEEFRTLRTRLNHLQSLQPIRSLVVTSPSPAEGKSFTAANLAIAESQLADNPTLLADFDFRRPVVHTHFDIDRSPGLTDYLQGKAELPEVIRKVAGLDLWVMPAGEPVMNPLELLNLSRARRTLDDLNSLFRWVILDTPPLLFAADANLLATVCHATLLVVRIGATTVDSVTRSMQSLCENNVVGIVVNGARRGELYSKYTYYHSYYYKSGDPETPDEASAPEPEQDV